MLEKAIFGVALCCHPEAWGQVLGRSAGCERVRQLSDKRLALNSEPAEHADADRVALTASVEMSPVFRLVLAHACNKYTHNRRESPLAKWCAARHAGARSLDDQRLEQRRRARLSSATILSNVCLRPR